MSHAFSLDSVLNLPAMGIPVVNYSPESTWEFGAAAQAYFRLPHQERTSIVQLDGTYSLNNQWYINAQGNLYFGSKPSELPNRANTPTWQLNFRVGYSDRPATYYGTGNEGNTDVGLLRKGMPYFLQRGYAAMQAPIAIHKDWSIGPAAEFLYAHYSLPTTPELLNSSTPDPFNCFNVAAGVVLQYDSRDVTFYPKRGIFFKMALSAAYAEQSTTIADPFRTIAGQLSTDLRQYIPLPHNFVVAWQFKTQWFVSQYPASHTLYPLLPRLGGQDGIRGVNSDMFRDDVMMALQAELRIPIWSIFRATVFAGVGDVYDFHYWHWSTPKVGYGIGLRAAINKAKVNIRFDIARSNVDPRWDNINAYSFYLTATEAF